MCARVCVTSSRGFCDWTKRIQYEKFPWLHVWRARVSVLSLNERFKKLLQLNSTCYCKLKKKSVTACKRGLKQSKWDENQIQNRKKEKKKPWKMLEADAAAHHCKIKLVCGWEQENTACDAWVWLCTCSVCVCVYVCVRRHRRIPAASGHFWDHSPEDQCATLFIPYLNSIVHRWGDERAHEELVFALPM